MLGTARAPKRRHVAAVRRHHYRCCPAAVAVAADAICGQGAALWRLERGATAATAASFAAGLEVILLRCLEAALQSADLLSSIRRSWPCPPGCASQAFGSVGYGIPPGQAALSQQVASEVTLAANPQREAVTVLSTSETQTKQRHRPSAANARVGRFLHDSVRRERHEGLPEGFLHARASPL
jgi:hypothetical protein